MANESKQNWNQIWNGQNQRMQPAVWTNRAVGGGQVGHPGNKTGLAFHNSFLQ